MKTKKGNADDIAKRQPPVKIPLSFNKAIEGLLAVRPKPKEEKPKK